MQASRQTTKHGPVFNVLADDGRHVSLMIPTFDAGTELSKQLANISARLEDYVAVINTANEQLQVNFRNDHLASASINVLNKAFVAVQKAAQDQSQKNNTARAVAMTVDPATPSTAPFRARSLARWDAGDNAAKARMALEFSMEGLASIIESGAIHDAPEDIRKIAQNRYMALRMVAKQGIQADYQLQPSLENPIASGPDVAAATAYAEQAVKRLNTASDAISSVSDTLRTIVDFVTVASNSTAKRAYQLLATGNIAA